MGGLNHSHGKAHYGFFCPGDCVLGDVRALSKCNVTVVLREMR